MSKIPSATTRHERSAKNRTSVLYQTADVVLPWEDERDFDEHLQACREMFSPEGKFQEEEVFEIARLYWVKRRLNVGYHRAYFNDLPAGLLAEAQKEGPQAVKTLVESQASLVLQTRDQVWAFAKEHAEAFAQVGNLVQKLTTEGGKQEETLGLEQINELKKTTQFYMDQQESLIGPLLKQFANDAPESEKQCRASSIEQNAKANAELERQIDKRIARLVNLKEYARLYGKGRADEACIDVTPTKTAKKYP
jgi:hypothetical protein